MGGLGGSWSGAVAPRGTGSPGPSPGGTRGPRGSPWGGRAGSRSGPTAPGWRSCARPPAGGRVLEPRVDPTGARVAGVADGALHLADLAAAGPVDRGRARRLVGEDDPEVSWGLAEFLAAEEMGRARGFWWAPDGRRLA